GVYDPTDRGTQPRGKQVLKPSGIYYTPTTGIWQTVWIEPVPKAHIESLRIITDIDKGLVRVAVKMEGSDGPAPGLVEIKAPDQKVYGTCVTKKEISFPKVTQLLGSKKHPALYEQPVAILEKAQKPMDTVTGYFGMRKIEVKKDERGVNRLFLNNKP